VAGLRPRGQLIVVGGSTDPIEVNTTDQIFGGRSVTGSLTGTPVENEENLRFSTAHGVVPMTEVRPFDDAPAAYERMMSGEARAAV
jgi:alcohol dehydrogenase, propanol-preferring